MVIKAVADYFNLKPSELKSKKRIKSIAYPRKIAMFILRDRFNLSLNEIGEEFGGKNHSTVLHSNKCNSGSLRKRCRTSINYKYHNQKS